MPRCRRYPLLVPMGVDLPHDRIAVAGGIAVAARAEYTPTVLAAVKSPSVGRTDAPNGSILSLSVIDPMSPSGASAPILPASRTWQFRPESFADRQLRACDRRNPRRAA